MADERRRKAEEEKKAQIQQNLTVKQPYYDGIYCSCVLTAKYLTGKSPGSVGYARNWPINSQVPKVGAVMVSKESSYGTYTGHVAVVTAVTNTTITLKEGNFSRCQLTTRTIPRNYWAIRGYWY